MGLIQFSDLAELYEELPGGHTVRVAVLETVEGQDQRLGIQLIGIGVHVRAFDPAGHVLACYLPVAALQMIGDTCLSDPGGAPGAYEAAWQKARALGDRVRGYLIKRFTVRPGVIDIGAARLLTGSWREDPGVPAG